MLCKNCGFSFSDHANFCPGCGKKNSEGNDLSPERPFSIKWLKITLGFLCIGIAVVVSAILLSDGMTDDDVFDQTPLKSAISELLAQIRQRNFAKAYEEYTANDFRKTTSLKDFETFVNDNLGFLDNQSVEFGKLKFDNNVAMMGGKLRGADGKVYVVEYYLVQENGGWKIFHVQVLDSGQEIATETPVVQFTKFILGSGLSEDGFVTVPKKVFKSNSGNIYLNLYADNAPADVTIRVVFEHVDTNSIIPPVSKVVSEGGNLILTFVFSAPPSGWPKGNYRLSAIASTGGSGSYDFKVEE